MANNTLTLLLGADRGRLKAVPTKRVEVKRLSDLIGAEVIGEDGKAHKEPVCFTIRALSGEEYTDARDMAMRGEGKDRELEIDTYQMLTLLHGVVDPDLKSKELREMYGAVTPEDLILRSGLLLPGERATIFNEITALSGFSDEAVTEVKN